MKSGWIAILVMVNQSGKYCRLAHSAKCYCSNFKMGGVLVGFPHLDQCITELVDTLRCNLAVLDRLKLA